MKLTCFTTLVVSFASGLALCGCASGPMQTQYVSSPYVNSGPAFSSFRGPDGQIYATPNQQVQPINYSNYNNQPVYYTNGNPSPNYPYGAQTPRYPYGYNGNNPNNSFLGTVAGAAVGNAIRPGDARAMALGAVTGNMVSNSDPCSNPNIGTVVGGAAGYAIGAQVGGGNGRKAAQVLGALIGANTGTRSMNGCR